MSLEEIKDGISFGWNVLSALAGALLMLIGHAVRFGGKLESLATKDYVDKKLEGYASKDAVERVEESLGELKESQDENFRFIIDLITKGRGA